MAHRKLLVESRAQLRLKNAQLQISGPGGDAAVPVEDIEVLVLENRGASITAAALAALAQNACTVFVCDDAHIPCGVFLPFCTHSRQTQAQGRQLAATLPLKKQLWKQIVSAKIRNEALCLELQGNSDAAKALKEMAGRVQSGDKGYMEARAAAYYFPQLFGPGFTRGDDMDKRNAALNYGYAIFRGILARHIAAYGLLPSLGLQHHSSLNAWNLADDLIEAFRPLVELHVARNVWEDEALDTRGKRALFALLTTQMLVENRRQTAAHAAQRLVQSLSACFAKESAALALPVLLDPVQQYYA